MSVYDDLIASVDDAEVLDVRVGLHWTAVVVERGGGRHCGLASTLAEDDCGAHTTIEAAGRLTEMTGLELAAYARDEENPTLSSIGMAAINALIPSPENAEVINAGDVLAEMGRGKEVALIGHFPFVPDLRESAGTLYTFDKRPRDGFDLPVEAQPEIIPNVDVLAMTSMTLVNHSFDQLLSLRKEGTPLVMLGPSTPMNHVLFDYGADLLSGSIVENIDGVLNMVSQGAGFRQIKRAGVKLITIQRA